MTVLVRPRWIVGHALALVAVVTFVNLGLWQLDRHAERGELEALLDARLDTPAEELEDLLAEHPDPAALAYRPARVRGRYDPGSEILLSTRTQNGRAGHHVLTPLRRGDGPDLLVDRGWVPLEWQDPPLADAPPPAGEVLVEGVLLVGEPARRAGRFDEAAGPLEFVSHPDIEQVAAARGIDLLPVYLLARRHDPPAPDGPPVVADVPVASDVDHLSYAGQWLLLAAVVGVGYPVLLWRTTRRRDDSDREGDEG